MYVVAIGWMYVVVMAAVAEGMSPQGTLLGALMTFIGWGLLPCALVLYILGTPARKRRLRDLEARQAQAAQTAQAAREAAAQPANPAPAASNVPRDADAHVATVPAPAPISAIASVSED